MTRKDAYPLPRIDDCLDTMAGSKYFTTFDLRCGYHQIRMNEEDGDKTSFVTRTGTYEFNRLPFGLCKAGSTFQRLMNIVMKGLIFEICLVHLDEIIMYSTTVEEHFDRLEQLFERLKLAKLKLKPLKCSNFRREVSFYGHTISGKGTWGELV